MLGDYKAASSQSLPYGREYVLSRFESSGYPNEVDNLRMSVYYETPYRCRVLIRDAANDRWEVPSDLRGVSTDPPSSAPADSLYIFGDEPSADGGAAFSVERTSAEAVFNTRDLHLYFTQQYIEISSQLPAGHFLYGFGERNQSLRLPPASYTLWNADNFTQAQVNMYGSHPAYWSLNPNDGTAHAVVLYNSNQLQVDISSTQITYRTTGGVLDFYFLLGPTPADVAAQYTELVGRPFLPPMWALGFHTCRWGFENVSYTREVVEGYLREDLPLDVVWNDIDYMQFYFDFTFDPQRFDVDDLKAFNDFLTAHGMHHVYIVDPGIPALLSLPGAQGAAYSPYVDGNAAQVFIRHPANDSLLYTCVWPSVPVVFPDFTHPNTQDWWTAQIQAWTQAVGLPSGLWLDMNEISSFVPGQLPVNFSSCIPLTATITGPAWSNITLAGPNATAQVDPAAVGHAAVSSASDIPQPPYLPGGLDPNLKSINTSAIQYASQFYNLHNLFGYYEQRATRQALEQLQAASSSGQRTRSFTLSRATFLGSGSQGASWTGDHEGRWGDLGVQVRMFMQMGLHGVTMIGSDLCGLMDLDETDGDGGAEACARWLQLGALSPFMRMHYQEWDTGRNREPWALPEPARSLSRQALKLRYSLLPYLNTLMVDAHLTGQPMWRPMWFDFVQDRATWSMDHQAMIGSDLLFHPVTDPRRHNVSVYLPQGVWYDFHTHAVVSPLPLLQGAHVIVPALYHRNGTLPLLMRGGRILATQRPGQTTAATHGSPLTLHIALDEMGRAEGYVYLEDGIDLTAVDEGLHQRIAFSAAFNMSGPGVVSWPLQGLVNVTGFNTSATSYNISGWVIERLILKGVTFSTAINVTVGGGQLGESCLALNATAVSMEGSALVVTELTGLLGLTAPLIVSFNDGCVLPPVAEESFSLVVPIVILVLMFLAIIAALVWARLRKMKLSQPAVEEEQPPVQARVAPKTVLSPSVNAGSNPRDYAVEVGAGEVRIKKKRRVKRTPKSASQSDLAAPLVGQRSDPRSLTVV